MRSTTIPILLAIVFSWCSSCIAQIELSYTVAKSLVGTTSPRIVGERILIGDDSKPQFSQVAVIQAKASEPYRLKARKSLFEVAELISLGGDEYLLVGEGEYLVEAVSLNHDRSLKVKIGSSPTPTPTPDPPKPKPDPVPDVSNDYNVGAVALTKAPSDVPTAKIIATSYRTNAAKLFGQGGLADIQTILNQIAKDFASKQCRDQMTCQQWDAWRVAVQSAMSAEQTKRKTFTRQDWYGCLTEIANALEAVK